MLNDAIKLRTFWPLSLRRMQCFMHKYTRTDGCENVEIYRQIIMLQWNIVIWCVLRKAHIVSVVYITHTIKLVSCLYFCNSGRNVGCSLCTQRHQLYFLCSGKVLKFHFSVHFIASRNFFLIQFDMHHGNR